MSGPEWTPQLLAELDRRRRSGGYPRRADIDWLKALGVYDVARPTPRKLAA